MDLPTYTNIWRIEKRLYKLYDFRLPMPLPINWIAVFAGITIPYIVLLIAIGLPFNHTLVWLYILPPGVLTWLTTRPVIENKRLPELVESQVRYLSEPRTFVRLAPLSEKDQVKLDGRVWRSRPVKQPAAAPAARRAPARPALPVGESARGANELGRLSQPLAPGPVLRPTSVFRPEQAAAAQEAASAERSPQVRPARQRPGATPAAPQRLRVQERSPGRSSGRCPHPARAGRGNRPRCRRSARSRVPRSRLPRFRLPQSLLPRSRRGQVRPLRSGPSRPRPARRLPPPVPVPPVAPAAPASAPLVVPVPASVRRTSAPAGRFSPAFLPANPPGWHHGDSEPVHAMPDVLPPSAGPAPPARRQRRPGCACPGCACLGSACLGWPAPAAPAAAVSAPVPVRGRAGGPGAPNLEVSHDGPRRPASAAVPRNTGTPAGGWPAVPLRPPAAAAPPSVRPVRAVPPQPEEAAPAAVAQQAPPPPAPASAPAQRRPRRPAVALAPAPGRPVPAPAPERACARA